MKEKLVVYYCPSCKMRLKRLVRIATKTLRSYCGRSGKDVVMRKVS